MCVDSDFCMYNVGVGPDMTFTVDWALKINYLSIYLCVLSNILGWENAYSLCWHYVKWLWCPASFFFSIENDNLRMKTHQTFSNHLLYKVCKQYLSYWPEGRPDSSDVSHLSGISGLWFDSIFLSAPLLFCLLLVSAFGPISCLLSRKFFKPCFLQIGCFVLPLFLVVVFNDWEMISWSVVSAACYLIALVYSNLCN